ncbi:Peroxisomal acyl-coenzyme A oxidase 1 [Colletotrichum sp. SAR11_59]|nr:Peroxisomal acyl-coenzyme A oxidase 1 [Colletotrichum sp. SAR11_59]
MPAALKSISKQAMAMANARSRTSFDVEKLTNLIYGGASVVRARRAAWARVEKALGTDDTSRLPGHYAKTSREDLYLDGLRMGRAVWEDRRTHNHAHFDWLTPRYTLFNYSPFGLSPAMFVKMLQLMATPAQQARWLTPALAGRINGAQHFRLLTLVAKAYGILFASKYTEEVHREFERRSEEGDFSTMTDAHALISGMKAWSSAIASERTEDARRACGGQGYLVTSGLPELVQTSAMMCTGEGDTHVLFQQLARYLMKFTGFAGKTGEQGLPADLRYLAAPYTRRCTAADFRDPKDEKTQLLIFQHRAQRLVDRAARGLRRGVEKGKTKGEAWNECIMRLMSAARAHTEYLILGEFVRAVAKVEDEEVKDVLERLRSVFALSTIVNPQSADALTFVEDGFLSEEQLDEIRHTLGRLLDELLPDAIGLTDAWDFTDAGLGSAIGRKDGEAYETLMSWTRQLPINKMVKRNGGVHPEAWRKYIRPALKGVEEDKKESVGSGIEFTPYEREHQVMMAGKAADVL